jgi:curved DNA-binding protein CbpA
LTDPRARPPRANPHINLKTLPLRPEEAFVFSRVDGLASPKDIANSTGLSLDAVEAALARLGQLGALEGHVLPKVAAVAAGIEPPAEDDFVPVSDLDISPDEQRKVWTLWKNLDRYTHYQLLGLPRHATREQVKAAYYDRVAAFHPDKRFKKTLGTYKEKLETIFQRLTVAHDTLSRTKRRVEYDATLTDDPSFVSAPESPIPSSDSPNRGHVSPASRPDVSERSSPTASSKRDVQAPHSADSAPTSEPTHAPTASLPPTSSHPDSGVGGVPPLSVEQRRRLARRALERGLRSVSGERTPRSSTPQASSARPSVPQSAPQGRSPSGAPPSHRSLLLQNARNAESNGHWQASAAIYEQLAGETRDAPLFAKAAECLERAARVSSADPTALWRRAAENARNAVQLAPTNVQSKLLLSRLFANLGMHASALREAERALELSPSDKSVQSWLERLRRGDV